MKTILLIFATLICLTGFVSAQEAPDQPPSPLPVLSEHEYDQMPSAELLDLMEDYIQRGEELYAMEQYKAANPYLDRANIIGDILLERARLARDLRALRELAERRLREAKEAVEAAEEKVQ